MEDKIKEETPEIIKLTDPLDRVKKSPLDMFFDIFDKISGII